MKNPNAHNVTVADFADRWWARESGNWTEQHRADNRAVLDRHILPELGHLPSAQLVPSVILQFRERLKHYPGRRRKPYSASRINSIMGIVRIIASEISATCNIPHPFGTIRRLPKNAPPPRPFSADEVERLLEGIEPHYRNYLTARLLTGMHGGELDELMCDQVDLERRVIHVDGGPPRKRGRGRPTSAATRDVPMSPRVFEAFRLQLLARQPRQLFVFPTPSGGRIDPANFTQRVWLPLLEKLGIEERTPYDLRHTAIVNLLQSNVDLRVVAKAVGHTSVESLVRQYGKYIPKVDVAAAPIGASA